ncbi:TonB-dependent receptor plug domain-containing protein [Pseudoduganella chitinolytica]|uniref:TonB-dependent receptor n=1 Tax=Pseudoduganella chitinolytica TaxID=34070 RepID=A0ABY8BJJ4_9BURK|nr:TonB-dependent receptor [Pseudoduganella chitinolytica]WEF34419.1 TonB-dependent receptor [Pseudoduganella chitinolytica]
MKLSAQSFTAARVVCLALAAAFALPAAAQPATDEEDLSLVYGDNDTVSIASGSSTALRRAPGVATVITAADIAAMGATDLDQVLETVPGLHVNRSANNYTPLYVVRGIVSQFTPQLLLLQDGVPVTTAFTGNKGNLWGGYPVEHIARIEVMRGPGSALYGSDAFSGVVNLITKGAADTPGTEVGVRAGSFRTRDGWLQHGGSIGPVDVAAYLRRGRSDGFRSVIEADAQSRNDRLYGSDASLAPGPVNVGYQALDANLQLAWGHWTARAGYKLRDDLGTGAGIASALDPVGRQRSARITTGLTWADPQWRRDWGLGAAINRQAYRQEIPVDFVLLPAGARLPTGAFPAGMRGGPDAFERILRLSAWADYGGWSGHHVRVGVGHDDLDMYRTHETRNFTYARNGLPVPLPGVADFSATDPFLLPQRRKIDYVYVQDEWRVARDWSVTAGVRHDRYSDFGGTTNPRLAVVWDASYDLTAKLLYGRAFRAPSFNESYSITNPVALGNPALKPETNGTLEAAFAWQARADALVNLTLFRYRMHDIIRTLANPVAGTGATYANAGSQTGRGLELEGSWTLRRLRLVGNYAYQRSVDDASGRDAGYAPRHHVNARADWHAASALLASAQVNWIGERQRAPGDARAPLDGYTTMDVTLATRRGGPGWNFTASVRNLLDADVREPSLAPGLALPHDLPMAPRAFTLQAVYAM